jgi:hypothetical protein
MNAKITMWADTNGQWHAIWGDFRFDLECPIGIGATMFDAIQNLKVQS